jgi:hypothetical protein
LPGTFIDPGEGRPGHIHDTRCFQVVVEVKIAEPYGLIFLKTKQYNLPVFRQADRGKTSEMGRTGYFPDSLMSWHNKIFIVTNILRIFLLYKFR